jgi:small basic protein (TIGR04137 family)
MSIHPTLAISKKSRHRSVLKRFERIKALKDKDKWKEEDSIFGLPKLKIIRIKIKKEKAAAEVAAEGATAAAPAAGGIPAAETAAKVPTATAKKPEAKAKEGK